MAEDKKSSSKKFFLNRKISDGGNSDRGTFDSIRNNKTEVTSTLRPPPTKPPTKGNKDGGSSGKDK